MWLRPAHNRDRPHSARRGATQTIICPPRTWDPSQVTGSRHAIPPAKPPGGGPSAPCPAARSLCPVQHVGTLLGQPAATLDNRQTMLGIGEQAVEPTGPRRLFVRPHPLDVGHAPPLWLPPGLPASRYVPAPRRLAIRPAGRVARRSAARLAAPSPLRHLPEPARHGDQHRLHRPWLRLHDGRFQTHPPWILPGQPALALGRETHAGRPIPP